MSKLNNLPNKYHVKYEEYVEDEEASDSYSSEYKWAKQADEYGDEPSASLAAINLVVERQKLQTPSGYKTQPQRGAVRNVRVTEETRAEEVLRTVDYDKVIAQLLKPERVELKND